jgi:hypothetical protein
MRAFRFGCLPMPRIIINGEEVRCPRVRFVLLLAAVAVPWAVVSARLRRRGPGPRG